MIVNANVTMSYVTITYYNPPYISPFASHGVVLQQLSQASFVGLGQRFQ